jgi:hypothetical protein
MFETYPKATPHPSKSVGEAQCPNGWPGKGGGTSYPTEGGASSTGYTGDRSHTKVLTGGSGKAPKSDFPGNKYETFGTEKLDKR